MFRLALYTQWKWSRVALLVATIVVFALPVLSVGRSVVGGADEWEVALMLSRLELWAPVYPITAALLGTLVASFAWSADQQGDHVYALSLPIPRWHYVLLRWTAGAVLLLIPIFALWVGALFATATTQIPVGLTAYPNALMLRYLLATFLAYALWFSIGQAGVRGLAFLLGVFVVLFVLDVVSELTKLNVDVADWLIGPVGPFRVFNARWLLIDV